MFSDIHVHHQPSEKEVDTSKLLSAMDSAGVEKVAVFSWYGSSLEEQEENIKQVGKIVAKAPDRLYGVAWIEPGHGTKLEFLVDLVERCKFRGFKMIPTGWYPYEDKILSYCQTMAELNTPCLFHSGILYFGSLSSKCCRPVFYENCLKIARFRFALAHVGWPWTDECIALYGQWRSLFRKGEITSRLFLDASPGVPPAWRKDVFEKLVAFGADEDLIFGTDWLITGEQAENNYLSLISHWKDFSQKEKDLAEKTGFSEKSLTNFFTTNFNRFFSGE
ncbi:MAG: amidohydrolase [Candidatus Omnitrophica bacterium]|nr:amidohydrolase [Candidatus Omnitrophota bacterium]